MKVMDYVLSCSSTCDLDREMLRENNIEFACFKYIIDGKEYEDNFYQSYDYRKFYEDISNGMKPTTSQVGYGDYIEFFEKFLKEGKDVLYIDLSSGISGDYNTLKMVVEELNEKYENKIYAVDSLCASSGQGMLVMYAAENRKNGMSIEDNYKWCEDNKLNIQHWFISTDLTSFVRGGRISKTSGFFGSMLKICPLMTVATDGTLLPLEKIRTKSKAMQGQINKMIELADNGKDYDGLCYICVSQIDSDAEILAAMVRENFPKVKDVKIFHIGTTIGSHTGPGTISLFFKGARRTFKATK